MQFCKQKQNSVFQQLSVDREEIIVCNVGLAFSVSPDRILLPKSDHL